MKIGVLKETYSGEVRVALTPASIPALVKLGHTVVVERGAGLRAGYTDEAYTTAGGTLANDRTDVFTQADIVTAVRFAGANGDSFAGDKALLQPKHIVFASMEPLFYAQAIQPLCETGATAFAMELIPRITKAQSMDVLSSMASVAGYKAVLMAANTMPKMFPMMMTAAGTLKPARVFVIGAGVAGLQAIATAKRLGAIVSAYDVRPVVKEQVESLGGKFVELPIDTKDAQGSGGYAKEQTAEQVQRQQDLMASVVAESDAVITTAAIPGRKSPVLVTKAMVDRMQPGSVIVDLAAERGGNCESTQPGETIVTDNGVTILGPTNLPATVPFHASQMYGNNITTLIKYLTNKDGSLKLDTADEIIGGTLVCKGKEILHPQVRAALNLSPLQPPAA